jgi:hypothetical protein
VEQRIFSDPYSVTRRLGELGLVLAPLLEAVCRGQYQFLAGTENDPPGAPSYNAWAHTVRALREYLLAEGWTRRNDDNFPLTVHPGGRWAIQVATGDEATGHPDSSPSTKQSKGPKTAGAISANQVQLLIPFPSMPLPEPEPDETLLTWMLLVHRSKREVRCELSLPVAIRPDGRVDVWRERIVLGSTPTDDEYNPAASDVPDIDFDIIRRA